MLEIERQNREPADDSAGSNGPDGPIGSTDAEAAGAGAAESRGLLRRSRRAVTRPAGPPAEPAAEPDRPGRGAAEGAAAEGGVAESGAADSGAADSGGGASESATVPARKRATRARATSGTRSKSARSGGDEAATAGGESGAGVDAGQAASAESAQSAESAAPAEFQGPRVIFQAPDITSARAATWDKPQETAAAVAPAATPEAGEEAAPSGGGRRRRRGGRGRGKGKDAAAEGVDQPAETPADEEKTGAGAATAAGAEDDAAAGGTGKRRRRRRRGSSGDADSAPASADDPPNTVVHVRTPRDKGAEVGDVQGLKGSTRLEAKRQRRREGRDSGRRRPPIITESEFLARREAVERTMVVRQHGDRTQIAVLEDGVLVEHYVDKASHQSYVGNVYLGKVQNVLPSMEAAFVDIGKGRNAVLYAGEVNFDASGLEGESKRIESALKSGQSILVQVTKDPIAHKGARLTSQVSLPGRYLVYVPGASMTGISRKLPDTERARLKQILKQVMPENAGVIVRTAAEGASEDELSRDVARLAAQWEAIERKAKTASAPELLYSEPDLTLRVVRDIFNEDFNNLVIAGDGEWDLVDEYVRYVAP
ncbi:MAG: ribonuclease E/G, partial [Actinobacteria bacterium]|nr:ribonuclease E/G [Actinomycetota bacterium]